MLSYLGFNLKIKPSGEGCFYTGTFISLYQGYNALNNGNYLSAGKSGLDIGMGYIGCYGSWPGFIISSVYFGIDNSYDGGIIGLYNDMSNFTTEMQNYTQEYENDLLWHVH